MRWFAATCALLAASVGLSAWMLLRDRDAAGWRPPVRQTVMADAVWLLSAHDDSCEQRCSATVLGQASAGHWIVRLKIRRLHQCFLITPASFGWSDQRGFGGVASVSCPST